jgi:hypothetical protein
MGMSAAANPPAIGSSDFARATRFDTTITVTGSSSATVLQHRLWTRLVPHIRLACDALRRERTCISTWQLRQIIFS